MPGTAEVAEIVVNGQRYRDWESVSVARNPAQDLFSHFTFQVASPIESAPNWAGIKLAIGDMCQIYLAGQMVISGQILGRQPAYDANQHALQVTGKCIASPIERATVDHEKGEFKKQSLSQIANNLLKPYGIKFILRGDTTDADKIFDKVNVQAGETVYNAIERLSRFRNIHMFDDKDGNLIGYRLPNSSYSFVELEEGRNIKAASAIFDYQGAFDQIEVTLQRPGNNDHYGDDARDVTGSVKNPTVKQHVPLSLMGEMPGDAKDAKLRAQHELALNASTQIDVTITVQGWQYNKGQLWIDKIGEVVSVRSPMLFTDDSMKLAIQGVNCTQTGQGTLSILSLVHPLRWNGGGAVEGTPNVPGLIGSA